LKKKKESEQNTENFNIGIVEQVFVENEGWIKHEDDGCYKCDEGVNTEGCKDTKEEKGNYYAGGFKEQLKRQGGEGRDFQNKTEKKIEEGRLCVQVKKTSEEIMVEKLRIKKLLGKR
jgi:hypothetical protein